jgi:hypothetical protein
MSYRQAAAHTLSQLRLMRTAADRQEATRLMKLLRIHHASYGAFKAKNGGTYLNQIERELRKQANS